MIYPKSIASLIEHFQKFPSVGPKSAQRMAFYLLRMPKSEVEKFARTSSKPGKTQTLNFYLVNDAFYLVDVPGYGYASVSKDTQKKFGLMIEEYLKSRENLKHVFMLIDYRHKPTEDDVLMYEFLKYYNLDITIVATKYDKVSKNSRIKQDKLIKDTLKFDDNEFITFSTVTKKGRSEVLSIIEEKI